MASSKSQGKRANPPENKIDYVQVEGLVLLRIIKHCQEEGSSLVDVAQGVLLGLAMDNRLEITNSFPFPRRAADEDDAEDPGCIVRCGRCAGEYQMEMMRHLRHVNVDHLHVGWYQSTHFGSYFNRVLLDSQYNYQSSIEESVVLIYDPIRTSRGFLSVRAYRLTPSAMALYHDGDFPFDSQVTECKRVVLGSLKSGAIPHNKIFEELPVVIRNSPLVNILQCELDGSEAPAPPATLDLGAATVLERNMSALIECLDAAGQETNKLVNYQRQLHKQQQTKTQYLQKRFEVVPNMEAFAADSNMSTDLQIPGVGLLLSSINRAQENAARAEKGEPPLPEEDLSKTFKPIPHPPRLDLLLLYGQSNNYCQQVAQFASQALSKLFLADALQNKPRPE
ncbi:EIF3H [Cordylochernes scorpioides]|uniref:Eukaryotic translation initiation factor 3 subunit H n=1 Tax=Cordylochernes scorpioides TaxID=51811 RepID=A0ABY6LMN7_9ARAC|nr:EIF3H [Cordylochernes scorpioides]